MSRKDFLTSLKNFISSDSIITDPDIIAGYSEDKSTLYKNTPKIVLRPSNKDEIIKIVALSREFRRTLICWGKGTSVTGSCLGFEEDYTILSMERFNKIVEIDRSNLIAVVEPGVITSDLKSEAQKCNLFYPPDPASFESSTIGGNIATGAGGPSAVKYGVTKDYLTGLDVITGRGEELKLGGKVVKKSSGYNLIDLFVSSEGTLGVITKIYLKLLPKPLNIFTIYITFSDIFYLLNSVNLILTNNILPISIEYIDDTALDFLNKRFNLPDSDKSRGSLIIQIEHDCEEDKEYLLLKIYNIVSSLKGFINFYPIHSSSKEREIWSARRSIGEIFKENFSIVVKADIVVPRGCIFNVIKEIKNFAADYGVLVSCFGHAGDGNIHINYLCDKKILDPSIIQNTYSIVKKYGGLPSGEHGIGMVKRDILSDFIGGSQISIMKEIKKIFDPDNILNKSKIFS